MASEQISLPYLIGILLVSGLLVRWLFFRPSPAGGLAGAGSAAGSRARQPRESLVRTREAAVVRIQQMFPQVERRTLLWDLQRTGGSIQATTERILSGRLETPPITFQPPPPPPAAATGQPGSAAQPAAAKQPEKPSQPDLITRYKLHDKVGGPTGAGASSPVAAAAVAAAAAEADRKGSAWSSNRDERQALLQRRREEMILAARRKMEAKVAADKAAAAAGS